MATQVPANVIDYEYTAYEKSAAGTSELVTLAYYKPSCIHPLTKWSKEQRDLLKKGSLLSRKKNYETSLFLIEVHTKKILNEFFGLALRADIKYHLGRSQSIRLEDVENLKDENFIEVRISSRNGDEFAESFKVPLCK